VRHASECVHFLSDAILGELEINGGEIGDRIAVAVDVNDWRSGDCAADWAAGCVWLRAANRNTVATMTSYRRQV
jgi:hypothetical protein